MPCTPEEFDLLGAHSIGLSTGLLDSAGIPLDILGIRVRVWAGKLGGFAARRPRLQGVRRAGLIFPRNRACGLSSFPWSASTPEEVGAKGCCRVPND